MYKVGIVGASGYVGIELLRLCAGHNEFEVIYATGDSQVGVLAATLYPSIASTYPNLVFEEFAIPRALACDVLFLALPHELSLSLVPELVDQVGLVVDCSAAFRLEDPTLYPKWYGFEHTAPHLLKGSVYGLPEFHRQQLAGAKLIATPGCYVTAAGLALRPLIEEQVISPDGVIVDAASGVSGAGRAFRNSNMFCAVDEDFTAYSLLDHRHTPEMEQLIGAKILFTPHLAPMNRGILATCYARPMDASSISTSYLLAKLNRHYANERFVVVRPSSPSTKATLGSNSVHISARFDERTGYVVVLSALDNLTKGAAGGALQSANVALGIDESMGLVTAGLYP